MSTEIPPPPAGTPPVIPSQFRVFGIGGAGTHMADHLWQRGLSEAGFAVLNTDVDALQRSLVPQRIQLGARRTRGLGAGGDPESGREAAEEATDGLAELCSGARLVFLMCGLGGGTGTGAAPVLARAARNAGALVLAVVTLPFDCEGPRRARQAQQGLAALREAADVVLCLPNQRILQILDEHTSLVETFRFTDELLAQAVHGLWRLVNQPGLIPVDFADLSRVVQGRHAQSCFAHAEATGETRAREAAERLLQSPLLGKGALLHDAQSVLVSVVAGPDLTLAEVHRIAETVRRECEGAEFVLGGAVDPALGDRLSLTLIGTHRCPTAEPPAEVAPSAAVASARPTASLAAEVETDFFGRKPPTPRPPSKFVAPPPELTLEQRRRILARQGKRGARSRSRPEQTLLQLEIVSRGRFEKSEPTIFRGEDLDVPTFVRRGVVLN